MISRLTWLQQALCREQVVVTGLSLQHNQVTILVMPLLLPDFPCWAALEMSGTNPVPGEGGIWGVLVQHSGNASVTNPKAINKQD